jgi:hypothetical protein
MRQNLEKKCDIFWRTHTCCWVLFPSHASRRCPRHLRRYLHESAEKLIANLTRIVANIRECNLVDGHMATFALIRAQFA